MNKCYVFIGPSGSGKTSIANALFEPKEKIVTSTTRPPRKGETDQKDYYFLSEDKFDQLITEQAFVEWDEYAGHRYGSTKREIAQKLKNGDCYTILTAAGFWALFHAFGEQIQPVFVTIAKNKLKQRLEQRGDAPDQIKKRLALFEQDTKELDELKKLPNLIVLANNEGLEATKNQFKRQIKMLKE